MYPMSKKFKTSSSPLNSSWRGHVRLWQFVNVIASQRSWRGNPRESCGIVSKASPSFSYARIFLIMFLTIPIGCSCFPEKSQEIEKIRKQDNKTVQLNIELGKYPIDKYDKKLQSAKDEIANLKQSHPLGQAKLTQLNTCCRKFIQEEYIPFWSAQQAYKAHMGEIEIDRSQRATYQQDARQLKGHIQAVRELLQENNTIQLSEFVLGSKKLKDK